jgi:tetratricopeptide (TPR) repeat protein
MAGDDVAPARSAVLRYAQARPVDPWSHKALVQLAAKAGQPQQAIASLEELDRQESDSGVWAHQLAQLRREAGQLDAAAAAMERALQREPYNGTYRELAATIELQRGQPRASLRHLIALTLLEPELAIHQVRLAALHHRMGNSAEADLAAQRALEMDPQAPVQAFLQRD